MRGFRASAGAAVLGAAALGAFAGVDAEVGGNAKVSGTLDPGGETETLRFDAVDGTELTLRVAAKRGAALDFDLSLEDPASVPVDLAGFPGTKDAGRKVSIRKLPLDGTGTWALRVRGAGTGEYGVVLKTKPPRAFRGTLVLSGFVPQDFPFSAPSGSSLKIRVKSSRGSAAVPQVDAFEGADVSGEGKRTSGAHVLAIPDVGPGGDVALTVSDRSGNGGNVDLLVKVKAPRTPKGKFDFRSAAGEDGTHVSRTVPAADGGVVTVEDPMSPLDGATVTVPPGALGEDARISVAAAPPPPPPDPGTQQAAGPAVDLGPSGVTFSPPALVTIPWDPAKIPVNVDPESDLRVLVLEDDGTSTEVVPVAVDTGAHTLTIELSGFSVCLPFVPQGSPDLEGREYWGIFIEAELVPDFEGDDSRSRNFFVGGASIALGAEGSPTGVAGTAWDTGIFWTHDGGGNGFVSRDASSDGFSGSWTYGSDGRTVAFTEQGEEGTARYRVSRDGSVLLGCRDSFEDAVGFTDVLVEKPAVPATASSLAGTYWFADTGFDAFGTGGPAGIEAFRLFGTLTLRADSTFTLSGTEFLKRFDPGTRSFVTDRDSFTDGGTFTVTEEGPLAGSLSLVIVDGQETITARFFPGRDGEVLLGYEDFTTSQVQTFAVAIRQGSGLGASTLSGAYAECALELELNAYGTESGAVGDLSLFEILGLLRFDGAGRFDGEILEEEGLFRDPTVSGGVRHETGGEEPPDEDVPYAVSPKGKLTVSGEDPFVGAVTADGMFGFQMDDPGGSVEIFGVFLLVELPPEVDP